MCGVYPPVPGSGNTAGNLLFTIKDNRSLEKMNRAYPLPENKIKLLCIQRNKRLQQKAEASAVHAVADASDVK